MNTFGMPSALLKNAQAQNREAKTKGIKIEKA